MTPTTAFLLHSAAALHDTGWGHPEHQGRMRSLASTVGRDMIELHGRVIQLEADPVDPALYELVHTPRLVAEVRAAVERASQGGSVVALDEDTRVSPASWDAVTGSTGALLRALRGVVEGEFRNAFVATRPPGHHATPDRAMGFCLFNHVAVGARWLQERGYARRILIVDWDVHHGNGTQDIFVHDPSVFFCSLHQFPHWPGSGSAEERGEGEGEGFTLNVPLAAGTSAADHRAAFSRAMEEIRSRFTPDFILVSSGFDAMAGDPLGGLLLEPADYHWMMRELVEWAEALGHGRVVALLEGGYDPKRTGQGAVAVLRALADSPHPEFPAWAPSARSLEW